MRLSARGLSPRVGVLARGWGVRWWTVVVSVVVALLLVWLGLIVALWAAKPDEARLKELLRLLPDLLRLLHRLARDHTLSRGVRLRLVLLLGYLALPFDLVPDFIPLRSVARQAGPEALDQHWPGTADGLLALRRLLRL